MTLIRVLDFEATGRQPPEHGLCEIGYHDIAAQSVNLLGDPSDWVVVGGESWLVNPGRNIPPLTSAIHHITDEHVRTAAHWKTVLRDLVRRTEIEKDIVAFAAHGADAEKGWFVDDLVSPLPFIDTYKVALRFWPESPVHSNQGLRYWRLPTGLDPVLAAPAHRAKPDAYVTAHLLRDLFACGCSIEQMFAWSNMPALAVRCYVGTYRKDGDGTPWPEVESSMLRWILDRNFKEEVMFTARHHLELRAEQARAAVERQQLNSQLVSAGLPPEDDIAEHLHEEDLERARLAVPNSPALAPAPQPSEELPL